jgi:dienelactone hydrolase
VLAAPPRGLDLIARAAGPAALVLLGAILAGCRPSAVPREETAMLDAGFIEVHVERPLGTVPPHPAVVTLLGEREALLAAGFAVVTFTVHWEQLRGQTPAPLPAAPAPTGGAGVWLLASPSPRTVGQRYFGLVAAQVKALRRVLDHVSTSRAVDPSRIGIAGSSTNGFAALEATAADRRVRAAVVVAACGDYHRFLELSSLAMRGAPLDLDPGYSNELHAREPARHAERLPHAAVLMINGTADVAVPPACARETAASLGSAYATAGAPEKFRLVLVDGATHNQLGLRTREEGIAWFARWLVTDSR